MTKGYQEKKAIDIWDSIASQYDENTYWMQQENHSYLKLLSTIIGKSGGKKIIEVGCGTGLISLALAKENAECYLLDFSKVALECAAKNFLKSGLGKPKCYNENALNNNVPSNFFDVVWNSGVIEHFTNEGKEILVLNMIRMAKPNGIVIIMVPNSWCWQYWIFQRWMKLRKTWRYGFEDAMSPYRLKQLCEKIKIKNFETFGFNPVVGWKWIPFLGPTMIRLLGLDDIKHHFKKTPSGYLSVLIIRKSKNID